MKTTFFDSPECRSGTHCRTCRAQAAGAGFRTSIAAYFKLPSADWDCPHGHPWGLDATVEAIPASEATDNEKVAFDFRYKICRKCDDFTGNHCEQKFPDGCCLERWHKFLHGHDGPCPLGKWTLPQTSLATASHANPWTPPANAAEICRTCPASGSCPNYCVSCGGKFTIVGPCPVGRW